MRANVGAGLYYETGAVQKLGWIGDGRWMVVCVQMRWRRRRRRQIWQVVGPIDGTPTVWRRAVGGGEGARQEHAGIR